MRSIDPRMGNDDFSARLAAARGRLSPKMAIVATYVADHYLQAAFMTTRELAAATGVSLATVVRLPAALGYANFGAMRDSIRDRVNFDLTGVERLQSQPHTVRSPSALLRRIVEADIASLRGLAQTFSEPQADRFVSALMEATSVTILGFRFVNPLAVFLGYSLSKVKPNVDVWTSADSTRYDRVRLMGPGAAIVALGVARYPADLVALLRYAHQCGVPILAITDSPLSPLLPLAEVALFVKTGMLDFVGSLAAPAALINCIVSELGVRLGEQAVDRLNAVEDAATTAGIFVPAGGQAASRSVEFLRRESGLHGRHTAKSRQVHETTP